MGKAAWISKTILRKTLAALPSVVALFFLAGFPAQALALSTVNLTPVEENAAEAGQVPGSFTVSRTDDGNLAQALVVRVVVSGIATIDTDYTHVDMNWAGVDATTYAVQIPAGQSSRTITLAPNLDNIIESEDTISLQLVDYNAVYQVLEENTIEFTITDFVELIFKDSFENIEP
jgi:hypothetical protein